MTQRRSALAAVTLATAVLVPVALGKGKPPATGPGCKPMVTVILKGTLTSDPGTGATSFTMDVTKTNKHGKELKGSLNVMITVDPSTKIRRQGKKTVDALASGDRALVQIRRCKADLPLSTATVDDVAASRVTAQAQKAPAAP
jgi:hypothetical protein